MTNKLTRARHDPAIASMGIFRPLKRGPRATRLDLSHQLGNVVVRIIGFEQLGADDQDVMLAVLAIAGADGKTLSATPTGPGAQALIAALAPRGEAAQQERLVVTTSLYQLGQIIGADLHSSAAYVRLRACLTRLGNVQCVISKEKAHGQENLLGWALQPNGTVKVAVSARLAQAILGDIHYITISLDERRALQSDPARILHSRLSAIIRPSAHWKFSLDALAVMVWGDKAKPAALRLHRHRIRKTILEIQKLPGWSIKIDKKIVTIGRPALVV